MKKLIPVLLIMVVLVFSCSRDKTDVASSGGEMAQKKAEEVTVTMFQLKVEIKDALDTYAAAYSAAHTGCNS
jgi:raffinose/stachyose/melibiose transport system substrate-binding protein